MTEPTTMPVVPQEPTADVVTLADLDVLEDMVDGTAEPQSYGLLEDLEPADEYYQLYSEFDY